MPSRNRIEAFRAMMREQPPEPAGGYRDCANCGRPFRPLNANHTFCNRQRCRRAAEKRGNDPRPLVQSRPDKCALCGSSNLRPFTNPLTGLLYEECGDCGRTEQLSGWNRRGADPHN